MTHESSIWHCKLTNNICEDYKKVSVSLQNPSTITFYSNYDSIAGNINNPCEKNNGNCSDLCITVPKNEHRCVCRVGYQLNSDFKSCRHITDFMLYTEKNLVKSINLNSNENKPSEVCFIPVFLSLNISFEIKRFEYDFINDKFYFIYGSHIFVTSIFKDSEINRILEGNENYFRKISLIDFSIDWISNYLYCIQLPKNYDGWQKYRIWVLKMDDTIEVKSIFSEFYRNPCDGSLTISADEGYLFFSFCDYNTGNQYFNKINLDGSNLKTVHQFSSEVETKIFAVDDEEQRIYFLNAQGNLISYADFDFENIVSLQSIVAIEKISSLYVHKEHLYISDSFSVWRFDKYTGTNAIKVLPTLENASKKKILGINIIRSQYFNQAENVCSKNNGGCDEYCFSRPQKSCVCGGDKRLENNVHWIQ